MKHALIILFTLVQLKSAECNVGCKYLSYSIGYFKNGLCYCVNTRKYSDIVQKEITSLPNKKGSTNHNVSRSQIPYIFSDY